MRRERPFRAFVAALRQLQRTARHATPTDPAPSPGVDREHPLRVADVMRRAGLDYLPGTDAEYRTACPRCGEAQTLADATVEPAAGTDEITAYRCRNGCTVLATTGHPATATDGCGWRFTVGNFQITALVPAGLQFTTGTPDH